MVSLEEKAKQAEEKAKKEADKKAKDEAKKQETGGSDDAPETKDNTDNGSDETGAPDDETPELTEQEKKLQEAMQSLIKKFGIDGVSILAEQLEKDDKGAKETGEIAMRLAQLAKTDKIRMVGRHGYYKHSSRSGWLKRNQTYKITDIEGGMATAEKLVKAGSAVPIMDPNAQTSVIEIPSSMRGVVPEDQRTMTAADLKKIAKSRQG